MNSLLRRKDAHMVRLGEMILEILEGKTELRELVQLEVSKLIEADADGDSKMPNYKDKESTAFMKTFLKAFITKPKPIPQIWPD